MVPLDEPAVDVVASFAKSCALTASRSVYCWGGSTWPDLPSDQYRPLLVPDLADVTALDIHPLAKVADGRVFRLAGWGWRLRPDAKRVELRYELPFKGWASSNSYASAIVTEDGRIDFEQHYTHTSADLERRLTAADYAAATNVATLAITELNACYVATDGVVMCAGNNDFGQLGDGTTVSRRTFAPVLWPAPIQPTH